MSQILCKKRMTMSRIVFALCAIVANGAVVEITDFTSSDNVRDMNTVDDPVMGGSSYSTSTHHPSCCLAWEGKVEEVWFLESPGFCILETSGRQSFPNLGPTSGISFFIKAPKHEDMLLLPLSAQITTGSMSLRGRPITYEGILEVHSLARVDFPESAQQDDLGWLGRDDDAFVPPCELTLYGCFDEWTGPNPPLEGSEWKDDGLMSIDDDAFILPPGWEGPGGVLELYAPWESFEGSFRGQKVADAPPLDAEELEKTYRIGLSTYNSHKAGSFRLELVKIVAHDNRSNAS
mmetsp:Transcript_46030/g.69433  ORF Transcript_46030/g.69433 Transcript_46030/m.69433 type:complete len:291 (+) Transcript_46030:306-1178(+)